MLLGHTKDVVELAVVKAERQVTEVLEFSLKLAHPGLKGDRIPLSLR